MGMKPKEQDFNALIGICVEKARHAVDDEEALDQIYQLLRLMREKGVSLSEGSYCPCLAFLVDMEMEQDFLFLSKWIKHESPEAVPTSEDRRTIWLEEVYGRRGEGEGEGEGTVGAKGGSDGGGALVGDGAVDGEGRGDGDGG